MSVPIESQPLLAASVLVAAQEVEAAEREIKDAILKAAEAGDCAKVLDITRRWLTNPAAEVLEKRP